MCIGVEDVLRSAAQVQPVCAAAKDQGFATPVGAPDEEAWMLELDGQAIDTQIRDQSASLQVSLSPQPQCHLVLPSPTLRKTPLRLNRGIGEGFLWAH